MNEQGISMIYCQTSTSMHIPVFRGALLSSCTLKERKGFRQRSLLKKSIMIRMAFFSQQNEASCFTFLSLNHLSIKYKHGDIISNGIKS